MWNWIFGRRAEPKAVEVTEPVTIPAWRKTEWGNQKRAAMKEDLIKFHPRNPELKHVRILLIGPVGAGKSSFITSVNNIFQERITSIAPTNTQSSTSYTTKYQTYHIENGNAHLSFVFNDIMGLEKDLLKGVHLDDIISAITGQIKDGHKFVPEKPLRDDRKNKYLRDNPTLSDEVFCLVYILPAHNVNLIESKVFEKMKEIRTRIKDLALPQVIVLTHVDEACPMVKKDLKKIYTSKKIREKMVFCSESVGVSMCHVFPVKNYHEEISINEDIDVLILQALDQIVHIADDCGNARADEEMKENREAIKEKLMKFRPRNPELKYVRILLVGSCGAGTSSFITSVNNIFQERITCIAPTNTVANSTLCTNKYKTYKIESGDTDLAFVLSDVMGLPPHIFTGIHPDDVITAIHGQMKDGYKFNPHQPLNDPDIYFRKDPTMSDEVFCLVYILPAFVHGIDHIFEKMKEIRSRIKDLELPQVIILTNVDQACALVKNDLKKIYTSRRIRDQMEYSSEALGVSMCHIFPVKNYHEEISINEDIDVLILQALDQIVHMADDCAFARSNKQN